MFLPREADVSSPPQLKPREYLQNGYKSLKMFLPILYKETGVKQVFILVCSINETFITLHRGVRLFSLEMNHRLL